MKRSLLWMLTGVLLLSFSAAAFGEVFISVRIGPPPLPVYAQPICPGAGYIWTPGYWAWSDFDGYYWVPGTWVLAPVGMLWTPGYWGWGGGVYIWHPGYWGRHVGFYGGINYGFGYTGEGFYGGEWRGRNFYYNRSVTNVSVTNVTNVYNHTVIVNNTNVNRVSYNGGNGVQARPTRQQETFAREHHQFALPVQAEHEQAAMRNRQNFAAQNHGRPAVAATARPADFSSRSVVGARAAGGEYHAPAMSPREARVGSNTFGNRGNEMNRGNSMNRNNNGFRPFSPPSKGGGANSNAMPRNNATYGSSNPRESSMSGNPRGNANRNNERPKDEYRQQNNGRGSAQPRPSAPPRDMKPSPRDMRPSPQEMRPNPREMRPTPQEMRPSPPRQGPPPKEEHRR